MPLVPTSLWITLIAPLTLQIYLLLLLLDLLLNFLNLLDLLLLIILKLSFTPLRIFGLVSHLRWVWIDVKLNRILRRSWLIVRRHLFLALILLNFLYFVVGGLVNFILWLRSFLNLIRKNNMRVLIRRLVIFRIVYLTLILGLRSIIILRNHLRLSVLLLTLKANWIVGAARASTCLLTAAVWLFLRRNFLLA